MATTATAVLSMYAKDITAIGPVPYLAAILILAVDVVNLIDVRTWSHCFRHKTRIYLQVSTNRTENLDGCCFTRTL